MNDEPLFQSLQTVQDTTDIAPRDCLYSTPLSWERPKLGCNPISYTTLSPEEESRLRSIAMPALSRPVTPPFSPSPEPQDTRKRNSRKRRSSESSGLTLRSRNAVDAWNPKRQHTTRSRSGTAQILTRRSPRFVISCPVCALSTRTTHAARA